MKHEEIIRALDELIVFLNRISTEKDLPYSLVDSIISRLKGMDVSNTTIRAISNIKIESTGSLPQYCAELLHKEQEKHKAFLGRRKNTNNKEVCVYYNNGTSTIHKSITQCAKDIGIHRDTVYTIINNIKSKKQEELDIKCIKYLKAD